VQAKAKDKLKLQRQAEELARKEAEVECLLRLLGKRPASGALGAAAETSSGLDDRSSGAGDSSSSDGGSGRGRGPSRGRTTVLPSYRKRCAAASPEPAFSSPSGSLRRKLRGANKAGRCAEWEAKQGTQSGAASAKASILRTSHKIVLARAQQQNSCGPGAAGSSAAAAAAAGSEPLDLNTKIVVQDSSSNWRVGTVVGLEVSASQVWRGGRAVSGAKPSGATASLRQLPPSA
jgi:hypothetical protein